MMPAVKKLKTCSNGHQYYKSSDCLCARFVKGNVNMKMDFSLLYPHRPGEH